MIIGTNIHYNSKNSGACNSFLYVKAVVLNQGCFYSTGDIWQFLFVSTWRTGIPTDIPGVKARNAATAYRVQDSLYNKPCAAE